MWSPTRIVSVCLLSFGLILFGMAQIPGLHWQSIDFEFLGVDATLMDGYVWGAEMDPDDFFDESCTDTWFGDFACGEESNATDADTSGGEDEEIASGGGGWLKMGFIFMILGGLAALTVLIVSMAKRGPAIVIGILGIVAALMVVLSGVLFMVGFDKEYDSLMDVLASDPETAGSEEFFTKQSGAGIFIGFAGTALILVGFVLDLVWRARTPHQGALAMGDIFGAPAAQPGVGAGGMGGPLTPSVRHLRCPRCLKVSSQPLQGPPACPNCGFAT